MFKILLTTLLVWGLHQKGLAQISTATAAVNIPPSHTTDVKHMAAFIQQNYATDTARIRAIYSWITHNIQYDIASFNARNTT